MGGNHWRHTGPYQRDLAAAFRQAQEDELVRDNHGFEGRSVEELWLSPDWHEYIFTGGTGSVLDFPLMIEAEDTDDGPFARPLTDGEVRAWAPHGGLPSRSGQPLSIPDGWTSRVVPRGTA